MAAFSVQPQRLMAAPTGALTAAWPVTNATPAIRYRCNLTEAAAITIAIHGVKPFHGDSGTRRPTEGTT
jgi:hypothetical protein